MKLYIAFLFSILAAAIAIPQSRVPIRESRVTKITFVQPKSGMQRQLEGGLKRHLAWRQSQKDPRPFFGWEILFGERSGQYAVGGFGSVWEDLDASTDPSDEIKNLSNHTQDSAESELNSIYIFRSDISQGSFLEDGKPSILVQAFHFELYSGTDVQFASVVAKFHEANARSVEPRMFSTYELVSGGKYPAFLLLFPLDRWAGLRNSERTFARTIEESFPGDEASRLLEILNESVRKTYSEVWKFRRDLSYVPAGN